jgi:glutamate decarboxylase
LKLLKSVSDRLIAFLADRDSPGCSHNSILSVSSNGIPSIHKATGPNSQAAALLTPEVVTQHLRLVLAEESQGKEGLMRLIDRILETSLNTWNQGFMHKLYAGTNPVGVISELVLAVLNTNVSL